MLNENVRAKTHNSRKSEQYNDTPVARDILINKYAERRHFLSHFIRDLPLNNYAD